MSSKQNHTDAILSRIELLGKGGLCSDDRRGILGMTLQEIAEEFRLPEWLLVRVVETLTMTSEVGREKEREDIHKRNELDMYEV